MSESTSGSQGNKVNRKASEVEEGQDRSSLASSDCEKKKTVHFESSSSIFTNFLRSVWNKMSGSVSNSSEQEEYPEFIDHAELQEENIDSPRYRPQSIEALCQATKFSEAEIKKIYRNFKAECPTGTIRKDTFNGIYAKFFPCGVSSYRYANYVFNTLDYNKVGYLNFEDFVRGLSVLCRGTLEEKLRWIFCLYDINSDGVISRDDLYQIVSSVYELMGSYSQSAFDSGVVHRRVETLFQKMDRNKNGQITLDEFLSLCLNDKNIQNSIQRLTMPPMI